MIQGREPEMFQKLAIKYKVENPLKELKKSSSSATDTTEIAPGSEAASMTASSQKGDQEKPPTTPASNLCRKNDARGKRMRDNNVPFLG